LRGHPLHGGSGEGAGDDLDLGGGDLRSGLGGIAAIDKKAGGAAGDG